MANGRILQIIRDGRRFVPRERVQLPVGAEANYYTLSRMAAIVREDITQRDLGNLVFRDIVGLDNSKLEDQITAAYEYCRDRIVYRPEEDGFETIADLWSCIYGLDRRFPVGDCAIKSVALATCLGFLKLRPVFVAIRQTPDGDSFDHVFVGLPDGNGGLQALDPTPENFNIGEELQYFNRVRIGIFK